MMNQNVMPDISTIPQDVYNLFDPNTHHTPNEKNIEDFAENLKELLKTRLSERPVPSSPLRFSSLGKPDRQMWFEAHPVEGTKEETTGQTYLKFLYGDVIEQLLLFLIKESGHVVEQEQGEVEIGGVKGHIDAIIDGVVVDVKSTSPYGYKKFEKETITEDDPFGYVDQLSGYANVLTPGKPAAWVAFDKVSGEICVSNLSAMVIKHHDPVKRIEHLKKVIESENIPPLCYEPEPDGKSGNLKLPAPCSYCPHKHRCHSGLRTFLYSTGPRFLTKVVKTPDVIEVR